LLLISIPIIIPNGIANIKIENKMIEDGFFKGKPCYYNLEPIVKDIGIS